MEQWNVARQYGTDVHLEIENWIKYCAKDIGRNLNEYLQSMRSSNTWGGGPELMIASKMYNIIIVVLNGL